MSVSITAVRHSIENPSIMICDHRNDSSFFVSEIIKISMSEVFSDTNISYLFRIELIFI